MQSFLEQIGHWDRLTARMFRALMYRDIPVYAGALIVVIAIGYATPFDRVLREDAFNYVLKGMQIAHGDFSLIQKISIGWPLLLGGVFRVIQVETLFEAMRVARWVSIVLIGCSLVPLMLICRQLLPRTGYAAGCFLITMAFILAHHLHAMGRSAMTEPLFILLTLTCAMFMTRPRDGLKNIIFASAAAALAYYVRPNGLFVFAAILGVIVLERLLRKTPLPGAVFAALLSFGALCLPYAMARYMEFGSMLDYGPNSKYFVDNYEQVWADNINSPNLFGYLATHDWTDYKQRFVDNGLFRVLKYFYLHLLPNYWMLLMTLGLILFMVRRCSGNVAIVFMIMVISIIGLTPVFQVFAGVRHLIYLIPFVLLAAVWAIVAAQGQKAQFANLVFVLLMLLSVATMRPIHWLGGAHFGLPEVKDHWAVRVAPHIDGKVMIVEGGDILKMSLHYAEGDRNKIKPFSEVNRSIETVRPGLYSDMSEALRAFAQQGIVYVVTDRTHIKRRPYLREIKDVKWKHVFQPMGHYGLGDRGAVLAGVDVYRIDYSKVP